MNGSVLTLGDDVHELRKRLIQRLSIQYPLGQVAHQIGDGVQRILVMDTQIGALRQELSLKLVGVLTGSTLRGVVRIAEVRPFVRGFSQFFVTGHLLVLVSGERLAHGGIRPVELGGEGRQGHLYRDISHLAQPYQPGAALNKDTHSVYIACVFDQVSLPMPQHQLIFHLGRAHMDAYYPGDLALPVLSRRAGPAGAAPLAQRDDQLHFELALRVGVDDLMGNVPAWVIGMHTPQCTGNLLRRPRPRQKVVGKAPQRAIGMRLCKWARRPVPSFTRSLRGPEGVVAATAAPEYMADLAVVASEQSCHRALAESLLVQRSREAFFWLQVRVLSGHPCNLSGAQVLHFGVEAANIKESEMIFFSVLFNPDLNALRNIKLALENGFRVVVYINKVNNEFLDEIKNTDCVILGGNTNVGLGIAFYEFEEYLSIVGEDYYIYFDQDTVVNQQAWEFISNKYREYFSSKDVGMVFFGNNLKEYSNLVVSSGCLFSMNVINRIGRHAKDYFVEGVDYEFCLRLRSNGLNIKNVYLSSIDHNSLQDNFPLKIFGRQIFLRKYGSRLKDFNTSHKKLIVASITRADFYMAIIFLKSLVLFNVKEYVSRLFLRKD